MTTTVDELEEKTENVEAGDGKKLVNEDTSGKKGGGKEESVPLSTFVSLKKEKQSLQVQLDEMNGKMRKISEDEQKKKGDLEGVIKNKEAEIAELNARINSLKVKADEYDTLQVEERKGIKEKLGSDWEEEFETLPLVTLRKIVKKLESNTSKKEPSGDEGAVGGAGSIKKELTADEKKAAAKMGLSEEGYLRYKAKKLEIQSKKEKKG